MKSLLYLLCTLMFFSCKKDKKLPSEPVIELVNVSSAAIEQFKDSIEVTIKYKDNIGDIGDSSPDVYSLQVKDSRLANPDWYHIPPLAPLDIELKIEGQIKVKLNTMFLLGNGNVEFPHLVLS